MRSAATAVAGVSLLVVPLEGSRRPGFPEQSSVLSKKDRNRRDKLGISERRFPLEGGIVAGAAGTHGGSSVP